MDPLGHTIKRKPNRRHSTFFFASLKLGEDFQHGEEGEKTIFTLSQDSSIKPWNSVDHLDSPFFSQKAAMIEPQKSVSSLKSSRMININVGGKVFHLEKCMVVKYPRTRIGNLVLCTNRVRQLTMCDDYSVCTDEFFFDRDPSLFLYVCHFYRSGVLWSMNKLCPVNFEEELKYWGVSLKETERCCHILFEEKVDELKECLKIERELMAEIEPKHDEEGFKSMYFGSFRKALWDLMENPYSSISAKFFAVFSSLFVLISIVAMTLNTVQDMKTTTVRGRTYLECVEIASILFFTVEYFLRLLTTCDIKHFLKSALNFVDLVAVMPYFIQLVFETFADREDLGVREDLQAMARVSKVSKVLKVVKLMRIFRILKLARHSTGMRAFGFTIRQCYQQVCCLFLFITMGIFTFSALMYSVEHDVAGTHFSSIPDAWWWAAVSISTVGYGDVVPVSFLGRVVAFLCISFGIILNGMPISILFNKFSDYYAKLKAQEEAHTKVQRSLNFTARLSRKLDHCLHPRTEDSDDLILH